MSSRESNIKKDQGNKQEIILNMSAIQEKEQQNVVLSSVICMIASMIICMGFYDSFEIDVSGIVFILISVICSPCIQGLLRTPKKMKMGLGIIVVFFVLYAVIFNVRLINGMTGISNAVINTVNENMAQANVKYVVSEATLNTDKIIASVLIGMFVNIVFNVLYRYRMSSVCTVLLLGSSIVKMLYKGEGNSVWITLSLLLTFIVMYSLNIRISREKGSTFTGMLWTGLFAVISIGFVLFVQYNAISSVDDLKDSIIYHSENIIYGKSDYPEGQLKRFHIWEYDDEIRLQVDMEDTQELHLKGYVGCKYTKKGWTQNDENIYGGDYTGMIDWFRSNNFYPLTQISMYLQYSLDNGLKAEQVQGNSIHIENISARSKYEYTPENLAFYSLQDMISPKQDINFVEQDLIGEKEYWFDIYQIEENDYLNFPKQSWYVSQTDGKEFIQAQNVYHSFVDQFYIDIPEEEKLLFDGILPECNNNIRDAIPLVRQYLKNQITYSEDVAEYDSNKNYIEQVLLEDQRGFSPQYATIATLMFRYYGIPARYVEGYYIQNDESEISVQVTGEQAHAWVEVYIDGFGFIPVEVTPGFYKEESGGGSSASNSNSSSGGGGTTGSSRNENQKLIELNYKQILKYLLMILIMIFVCGIVYIIVRRFVICNRRKKRLASDNLYVVLAEAGIYIEALLQFEGHRIVDDIPNDLKVIFEKTKFSNHLLKQDELKCAIFYMNDVLERTWKNQKLFGKMKMLFVDCLR